MNKSLSVASLAVLLAITVVLNGAHAKDILSLSSLADSQNSGAKIAADLHPHVDKQINKMTQDTPQLDGRSIRLRDYKRIQLSAIKNWLDSWRDQLSLLLS